MDQLFEQYKDKTVLITGGYGYVGSRLATMLSENTKKLYIASRSNKKLDFNHTYLHGDINSVPFWDNVMKDLDIVFHLACNPSLDWARKNPDESLLNAVSPVNSFWKSAYKNKCKPRLIFASSATVYGLTDIRPVHEDTIPRPISIYDLHKYFAEHSLSFASNSEGFEAVAMRFSNVYGPSEQNSGSSDRGILNMFINKLLNKQEISLYGHGNYIRDYIFIDDLISGLLISGITKLKNNYNLYNLCSGNGITLIEMAKKIAKLIGEQNSDIINKIEWPQDFHKIDQRDFVGDNSKILHDLKWAPEVSINEGLIKTINYFRLKNKC